MKLQDTEVGNFSPQTRGLIVFGNTSVHFTETVRQQLQLTYSVLSEVKGCPKVLCSLG